MKMELLFYDKYYIPATGTKLKSTHILVYSHSLLNELLQRLFNFISIHSIPSTSNLLFFLILILYYSLIMPKFSIILFWIWFIWPNKASLNRIHANIFVASKKHYFTLLNLTSLETELLIIKVHFLIPRTANSIETYRRDCAVSKSFLLNPTFFIFI